MSNFVEGTKKRRFKPPHRIFPLDTSAFIPFAIPSSTFLVVPVGEKYTSLIFCDFICLLWIHLFESAIIWTSLIIIVANCTKLFSQYDKHQNERVRKIYSCYQWMKNQKDIVPTAIHQHHDITKKWFGIWVIFQCLARIIKENFLWAVIKRFFTIIRNKFSFWDFSCFNGGQIL